MRAGETGGFLCGPRVQVDAKGRGGVREAGQKIAGIWVESGV